MKKLYWLALVGVLSLALLAGCPGGEDTGSGGGETGPTPEETATPSGDVQPASGGG
jgi:hypothetical protein